MRYICMHFCCCCCRPDSLPKTLTLFIHTHAHTQISNNWWCHICVQHTKEGWQGECCCSCAQHTLVNVKSGNNNNNSKTMLSHCVHVQWVLGSSLLYCFVGYKNKTKKTVDFMSVTMFYSWACATYVCVFVCMDAWAYPFFKSLSRFTHKLHFSITNCCSGIHRCFMLFIHTYIWLYVLLVIFWLFVFLLCVCVCECISIVSCQYPFEYFFLLLASLSCRG